MEEKIHKLQEILIAVATGKERIENLNDPYRTLWNEVDQIYKASSKDNPNPYTDLWQFYSYWKKNLSTYADRRDYVFALYRPKNPSKPQEFWNLMHPEVQKIAKSRFESGHLADAVEAVFKDINVVVKKQVHALTGDELDGVSLMTKAFSRNNPILPLSPLKSTSDFDIQQGYMQIFAGSMSAIRNPKAHDNIVLEEGRAIHLLYLASLLYHKLDESKGYISPVIDAGHINDRQ